MGHSIGASAAAYPPGVTSWPKTRLSLKCITTVCSIFLIKHLDFPFCVGYSLGATAAAYPPGVKKQSSKWEQLVGFVNFNLYIDANFDLEILKYIFSDIDYLFVNNSLKLKPLGENVTIKENRCFKNTSVLIVDKSR